VDKETLVENMKVLLASSYSVALKAQNYHWNVTGPNFGEYHTFFGDYYGSVYDFNDLYAEHIRQLGSFTPGSLERFSELTKITDETAVPGAKFMMVRLESDNKVILSILKGTHAAAEEFGDLGLVATLEDAIRFHSKMSWMLESYLA